jgi:hypothetical protein
VHDRWLRVGAAAVLITMAAGVVSLALAMHLYPGGNSFDRQCLHHSFWFNFLCDLTGGQAVNGASNVPGSQLARAGIVALSVALGAFWLVLPALFPGARAAAALVRTAGAASALGLMAVPLVSGPAHAVAVFAASVPGLVAAVTGFIAIVRGVRDVVLLGVASGAIAAGVVDSVLYARRVLDHFQSCPPALPALQRVAFLLMLAWMGTAAWRVLQAKRPRSSRGPCRST